MPLLVIGLLLFVIPHLLRETRLRDHVFAKLPSAAAYKGAFSLATAIGICLIVLGKSQAIFFTVWQPPFEWRVVSHFLMLPGVILVTAGNLPPSHLAAVTRNPMLLGVGLWGLAHLWSNGDLASILLFGCFAVWSMVTFVSMWGVAGRASFAPGIVWDAIAILLGSLLYALVAMFHGHLFGVGLNFA